MTYLPVEQLDSQANLLAAKFEQGEGANYIDDTINLELDREALELCCQPGHPTRPISSSQLATLLNNRYDQLKARRDLEEVIILGREALYLPPVDTLVGLRL